MKGYWPGTSDFAMTMDAGIDEVAGYHHNSVSPVLVSIWIA
jgi:hypothetical protein